ncbi:unnamed protein product, partial [Nesidiocoris tenuis]
MYVHTVGTLPLGRWFKLRNHCDGKTQNFNESDEHDREWQLKMLIRMDDRPAKDYCCQL